MPKSLVDKDLIDLLAGHDLAHFAPFLVKAGVVTVRAFSKHSCTRATSSSRRSRAMTSFRTSRRPYHVHFQQPVARGAWVPAWGGLTRKLLHSDIHFPGSPAAILRLAIGLCVDELAEIEREACRLTRHRTLGFAGNRQDGGTAKEKLATGLDEFTGILVDKGGEQLAELYAGTTHRRRPSLRRWATGIGVARACECRVGVHEW
jgi:hypothetical protein